MRNYDYIIRLLSFYSYYYQNSGRVLLAVSEGQRVDEVDESTHTLQNYEDFKELVVAVFGGMVDPRMENLFLKLLELILRREMRAYVDASQR